ncbi:hypothetical protein UlMin_008489 [Ulmus minor]
MRQPPEKKLLSALQFKKGLKRKEPSFIAVAVMFEEGGDEPIPPGIKVVLRGYADIMPDQLPKSLPPRRAVDHEIELLLGSKPPAKSPYRMAPPELEELRKQLNELLAGGFIRPSKAPYGAPFVVVYLDDIVVYSTTIEEHKKHLKMVFQKLRENQLYVKREKYAFTQTRINFLGHIIESGQIRMDMKKVRAIQEWKTPANVKELRSFLGLANYYRRFVEEYSKTAAPLIELLKKGVTWDWGIVCEATFQELKNAMMHSQIFPSRSKCRPMRPTSR